MNVTIDGYSDFTEIGSGGFATVYRAQQKEFNRSVALKVLTVENGRSLDRRTFENECKAVGTVSEHPNIVTVYESGFSHGGKPYISMELYKETLHDRIRSRGFLPYQEVLDVAIQLCGALERAHSAGILHCDIKPQNILFSGYGQPALADFGIASLGTDQRGEEAAGFSLSYAAPEVIDGASPSIRADLYSLGATLYTALAGERPFTRRRGEPTEQLMERILHDLPPAIASQNLPPYVEQVFMELLAKHANSRPARAVLLGERLREAQGRLGLPQTALPIVDVAEDLTVRRSGRPAPDSRSSTPGDRYREDRTDPAESRAQRERKRDGSAPDQATATQIYRPQAKYRRPLIATGAFASVAALTATGYALSRGSGDTTADDAEIFTPTITVVDLTPLPAPERLQLQLDADATADEPSATLSWEAVEGAASYLVEYSVGEGEALSSAEPAIELPLDPGSPTTCLTVQAVGDDGRLGQRSEANCTP